MADYTEGTIYDYPDGTSLQLKGGQWVPYVPRTKFETYVTGPTAAVGSGVLHEGVPGVLGLPGDVREAQSAAGSWLNTKVKDLTGVGVEDIPGVKTEPKGPERPSVVPTPGVTPGEIGKKLLGAAGGPIFGNMLTNMPTSEQVKGLITKVVPEYEPQNFTESALKTAGGFAPSVALAPEALAVRTLPAALGKYALAPGVASEGAGQLAQKLAPDSPGWETAARTGAAMLTPSVAGKIITPRPTTGVTAEAAAEHTRMVNALRNEHGINTMTPAQIANDPKYLHVESARAKAPWSGTSPAEINTINERQVTQSALRHNGINAETATPQAMQQMRAGIDAEFNRLSGAHQMPYDSTAGSTLSRDLNRIVRDYNNNTLVQRSPRPGALVQRMEDLTHRTGVHPQGFMTGQQYRNFRNELHDLSVNARTESEGAAFRGIRDALDRQMERTLRIAAPQDVGAFNQVRQRAENQMILQRARDPNTDLMSPKALQEASRVILGEVPSMQHPLGRLGRAASHVLKPLPGEVGEGALKHDLTLALTLAGGGLGGGGSGAATGHDPYWTTAGYVGGAALGNIMPRLMGRYHFSPMGRYHLSNQALPNRPMTQDQARALLTIRALQGKGSPEAPPP